MMPGSLCYNQYSAIYYNSLFKLFIAFCSFDLVHPAFFMKLFEIINNYCYHIINVVFFGKQDKTEP